MKNKELARELLALAGKLANEGQPIDIAWKEKTTVTYTSRVDQDDVVVFEGRHGKWYWKVKGHSDLDKWSESQKGFSNPNLAKIDFQRQRAGGHQRAQSDRANW